MIVKHQILAVLCFIALATGERWSRQISNTGFLPEAVNDWIPLSQSCPTCHQNDRTNNARVLNYQQNPIAQNIFNPNTQHHNQGFSVGQPFQFQRFLLPQQQQPQEQQLQHQQQQLQHRPQQQVKSSNQNVLQQQPPTSQSFFNFEMPSYHGEGVKQKNLPNIQTGYQIHHSLPQQSVGTSPLFSQKPVFPPQFHPQYIQPQQQALVQQRPKSPQQNFIEDTEQQQTIKERPLEAKPTHQEEKLSLQPPEPYQGQQHLFQPQKPTSFHAQLPFIPQPSYQPQPSASGPQDEEVQLLYVPYDTLYEQRTENLGYDNSKYSVIPPPVNPAQINSFYTPDPITIPTVERVASTTTSTTTTFKPSTTYENFLQPLYSTTPKPKPKFKPRPHQPPLAMFMLKGKRSSDAGVNDVLSTLHKTKAIDVLDTPTATKSPLVFIGPGGLSPPNDYTKFELPYLSSIDRNDVESRLREIPFFVAPLSYKSPQGFTKIPLPEPHVGSLIFNKPFETLENNFVQQDVRQIITQRPKQMYITPFTESTTPRYQSTTQRLISTTPTVRHRYQFPNDDNVETLPTYEEQHPKEIESRPSSTRQPYRNQESIHRGRLQYQTLFQEQQTQRTPSPYASFKPMPNHVVNEEYFSALKVKPLGSSSTTLGPTSTPTSTTTSTTETPQPYYTNEQYSTGSGIEISPTHSNVYEEVTSYRPEVKRPRYTPRPTQYTTKEEEQYRMKTYFREQEAFKHRPSLVNSTPFPAPAPTSTAQYEMVQYTPVSLDYERQIYGGPSSTPSSYYEGSTPRTPSHEKITFFSPSVVEEEVVESTKPEEVIPLSSPVPYEVQPKDIEQSQPINLTVQDEHQPISSTTEYQQTSEKSRKSLSRIPIPSNHRPQYDNEIIYNHNEEKPEVEQEIEYDPNPYQLPSELPPLTPNLPGLVNALIEKERLNALEKSSTTEMTPITSTSTTYRPTRRPTVRGKRPTTSKSSSSYSQQSLDPTTRRIVNRGRRPYSPTRPAVSDTSENTNTHPKTPPTTTRKPIIRNPNRVRYNPTPEERQRFRSRTRNSQSSKSNKKGNKQEDNIEYQRDVLKQNYPVFKSASSPISEPIITTTTENIVSSSEIVVSHASNDNGTPEQIPGLLEPMQIAQEYHKLPRDNYGPGYFPNEEEELALTDQPDGDKSEVHPVFSSSSISSSIPTTTEFVQVTTRRPNYIRRASRPTRTTTEQPDSPTTITPSIRPRIRQEISNRPKPIKIRGRTRKPHPASTTTQSSKTKPTENSYQELSRFNQDFYQDDYRDENSKIQQSSPKYGLEPQESQWSPSLSHAGGFQPIDPNTKAKFLKDSEKFDNEPEIVTAGRPEVEEPKKPDTFLFNVSASFGPSVKTYGSVVQSETKEPKGRNLKSESDEILADVPEDRKMDLRRPKTEERARRRGVWKKVRVHSSDSFEIAESQNIGKQLYNSLYNNNNDVEFGTKLNFEKGELNDDEPEEVITKKPNEIYLTTTESYEGITESIVNQDHETEPSVTAIPTIQTEFLMPTVLTPENATNPITTFSPISDQTTEIRRTAEESYSTESQYQDYSKEDSGEIFETTTNRYEDEMPLDATTDGISRRSGNEDDDLETQPSLFDEVKKQISELFAVEANDDDDLDSIKPKFRPRKQEYTSIQRIRAMADKKTVVNDDAGGEIGTTESQFHKNLMGSVVYATSTSTEVSHETEICYRGRCVKATNPL